MKTEETAKIISSERWECFFFDEVKGQLYTHRSLYRLQVPPWLKGLDDDEMEAALWLFANELRSGREENIGVQLFLKGQDPDGVALATLTWDGRVVRGVDSGSLNFDEIEAWANQ